MKNLIGIVQGRLTVSPKNRLQFFPKKWRKKVDQDTLVGLALIFSSMLACFLWVFYFYFKIF